MVVEKLLGLTPEALRRDLQDAASPSLRRRRGIIAVSLAGLATIAPVVLLQTGLVRHLPDPPLPGFDSDRVNSSRMAYEFGAPDGAFVLASFALNVPLAALGGRNRASTHPWIPIAACAKAAVDAAGSAYYFAQMPLRLKGWCAFCIGAAAVSAGVLALSIPEAREAWRRR